MKLRVLDSGFNTGKVNMDIDIQLSESCLPNEVVLRFYRWKPYCISLGANQKIDEIKVDRAKHDGIDVVFRPTGGRAILHAEELTYSVIYPIDVSVSSRFIYHEINTALLKGLSNFDNALSIAELETIQTNFPNFYKEELSSLCFAVPAKSEIKFGGKKLVGSAQKKMKNVLLQHGSVICGDYHLKIVDYLNIEDENVQRMKQELENKTTSIISIINKEIDYAHLISCLTQGFKEHFSVMTNAAALK